MIKIGIQSDIMADGVQIGVLARASDGSISQLITGFQNGRAEWKLLSREDEMTIQAPTMTLSDDVARALMDELVRHYHGASDTRALRRDYDHEKARVDKMIDALIARSGRG